MKIKAVAGTCSLWLLYSTEGSELYSSARMHLGDGVEYTLAQGFTALLPYWGPTAQNLCQPEQVSEPAPPTDLLDPRKTTTLLSLHLFAPVMGAVSRRTNPRDRTKTCFRNCLSHPLYTCFAYKKVRESVLFSELHLGNPSWQLSLPILSSLASKRGLGC